MSYPNILFICRANVGRSQMAEAIYNHIHGNGKAMSIAGCEARKEKYHSKPADSIVDFMKECSGLDLSNQSINYLSEIPEQILGNIEKVIFFYIPTIYESCDSECMKNGYSPYEYFMSHNKPIQIYAIPDPFEVGNHGYSMIFDKIYSIIKTIS